MIRRTFLVLSASMLFGAYGPHSTLATYRRLPRAHQALHDDQATSTSLLVGYWHKASSQIALPRELLISYLQTQSNAVASAIGLTPAPAPAPDDAAAPPSLQAPSSVYLQTPTPASPGNCSFDNYRPFYLNPERQLEVSATLQSLADNAEVQILSLTNQRDGPRLASVNGAEKLVKTLQMLCAMQCVADRGDGYSSPAATFYSNDYSRNFHVRFYGRVPGSTFECIKESTDLIQDTP